MASVATAVAASEPKDADGAVATNVDKPRLVATRENIRSEGGGDLPPTVAVDGRYIAVLERENSFLRDQIGRKDMQIGELSERARETNFLIKGLQNLVLRLQPGRPEPASVPEPRDGASDGGADAIS